MKNKDFRLIESVKIILWGETVGYLAQTPNGISFEYDQAFKKQKLEISPLELPTATTTIYTSTKMGNTFKGLPGIFADSLPDTFGQKVIDNYFFNKHAITSKEVTPLMSLAYLSTRSIGALEYLPGFEDKEKTQSTELTLATLVDAAKKTINGKADIVIAEIMRVAASPGGIKAKAMIDYNPQTSQMRSGFNEAKKDYIPCMIKFDGVTDGEEAGFYGKLEYVYNLVAQDSGITVPRSFLIEGPSDDEFPAYHFVVERFDRDEEKNKAFHVATYCGLTTSDFRVKNSSSYEGYLRVVKGLCAGDVTQVEQALKRCIFNLVMRNEDDHTKNFSFLMDRQGLWTLSPAYDLNYVRIPNGSGHQMSINNKNKNFTKEDLIGLGKGIDIKANKTLQIIEEVESSARKFLKFADEVNLDVDFSEGVERNFNWYL